ncbi:MAG: tRNA pseudouridine(55) synthase TruB [Phycisphaerales bacterium]|nr:MAG: tRNA pseudouridine(55) synthase TruB [Phycisphaerales bacterium]
MSDMSEHDQTRPERASVTPPTPGPTGVLLIDKTLGHTSASVCNNIKRRLRRGGAPKRVKVGHGGTLDPLASGVLVVLIGKATRCSAQVMGGAKTYEASVDLSCVSPTDDLEGETTVIDVPSPPSEADVRAACARFVGEIQQRPPAHSAMRIDGTRAYKLARSGQGPQLAARPVRIDRCELTEYAWPIARLEIDCGKGTYIRSLARDLGESLGTGGVLAGLRRTRVGMFTIDRAKRVDDLAEVLTEADLERPEAFGLVIPPKGQG